MFRVVTATKFLELIIQKEWYCSFLKFNYWFDTKSAVTFDIPTYGKFLLWILQLDLLSGACRMHGVWWLGEKIMCVCKMQNYSIVTSSIQMRTCIPCFSLNGHPERVKSHLSCKRNWLSDCVNLKFPTVHLKAALSCSSLNQRLKFSRTYNFFMCLLHDSRFCECRCVSFEMLFGCNIECIITLLLGKKGLNVLFAFHSQCTLKRH